MRGRLSMRYFLFSAQSEWRAVPRSYPAILSTTIWKRLLCINCFYSIPLSPHFVVHGSGCCCMKPARGRCRCTVSSGPGRDSFPLSWFVKYPDSLKAVLSDSGHPRLISLVNLLIVTAACRVPYRVWFGRLFGLESLAWLNECFLVTLKRGKD